MKQVAALRAERAGEVSAIRVRERSHCWCTPVQARPPQSTPDDGMTRWRTPCRVYGFAI